MTQPYLTGLEGEARKTDLSQFYTPRSLARRIAQFTSDLFVVDSFTPITVLEPSCGRGALIEQLALAMPCRVTGVDIDPANISHCEEREWAIERPSSTFFFADFLTHDFGKQRFDVAVMNPPFEDGQTEAHVTRALMWCDRVIVHCPLTTLAGQERGRNFWSSVELHRLAICSKRYAYGGSGGATEMCTMDITRRNGIGLREPCEVLWWLGKAT